MPSEIPLPDLAATENLAARIAPLLKKGDVIALSGDLGAGKTEFARALLHARGIKGDVPSPTFTLVQTYEAKDLVIHHFDLYRLKSADELEELGWDDALLDVVIVEWPERAGRQLPIERLGLHFVMKNEIRSCRICSSDKWLERFKL